MSHVHGHITHPPLGVAHIHAMPMFCSANVVNSLKVLQEIIIPRSHPHIEHQNDFYELQFKGLV